MYYVYLLESVSNGRYYIGQTQNLERRLEYHNRGKCKYTKGKGPWKILVFKTFKTRSEAMKEEYRLKKNKNRKQLRLVFGIKA